MTEADFGPHAEAYARARPGYPASLVEAVVASAGVTDGDAVADLGAGTGLFTALLAGRGLQVTAVEPSEGMRERAPALPGVTWVAGTFEATGLATASQRWAVAAQAFHWADLPRALPEVQRILAPGARFTVLWNVRDDSRSPLLRRTHELIEELAPGFDEGYRYRDWAAALTAGGRFADPVTHEADHVVTLTAERYLDLWRSHHVLARRAGDEGVARLLAALAPLLPAEGTVAVPYRCRAWTVRRLEGPG